MLQLTSRMKKILVLCTGNSCRSQMAEGYLRRFAGPQVTVFSAGLEAHGLNPRAVVSMKEDGIDISGHTSNTVETYTQTDFDFIITVCDHANEHCPVFPGKARKFHRDFPDPAKAKGAEAEIMTAFRSTRDQIKTYCMEFVRDNLS